jgi:hypothetical protein
MRPSTIKKPFPGAIAILVSLLLLASACVGYGAETSGPPGASEEEREIDAAVRKYLDAEVARELRTVYDCLAPSSVYLATHDYDAYRAEAEASPVRIRKYTILRIAQIRVNDDKQRFPHVEKFAEVEVDLNFHFIDTHQAAEVNFNFTFIKEGGRWYKG